MRSVIALLGAMLAFSVQADEATREVCAMLQEQAEEIRPQLPMTVDFATTWAGYSAAYSGGVCRVRHSYIMDSDALIDFTVEESNRQGASTNREAMTEFFASDEGREKAIDGARQNIKSLMRPFAESVNIEFQSHYVASEPLGNFVITVRTDDLK